MPEWVEDADSGIYQAYGTFFLRTQHPFVRRLKRYYAPTAHGTRAWQSSFVLIDYLQHSPPKVATKLMDLGCGWSAVGVHAAVHWQAKVTGVDIDPNVFPYMHLLASLNHVKIKERNIDFAHLATTEVATQNIIVGADICYWDGLVDPLQLVIEIAMSNGVTRIVLADPGRPTFYELATRCEAKWNTQLRRWYAVEPNRYTGEILEIQPLGS